MIQKSTVIKSINNNKRTISKRKKSACALSSHGSPLSTGIVSCSPPEEIHYISLEDEKQRNKKHRSTSVLSKKTFVCDRISCSSTMAKTKLKNSDDTKENKEVNNNKMTLSEWRFHLAEHMVQELAQIQYVLTRATKDGLTLANEVID